MAPRSTAADCIVWQEAMPPTGEIVDRNPDATGDIRFEDPVRGRCLSIL
jgi:hypothetical protein